MAKIKKSSSIIFDALTLEGGLIAPAMLERIAARDAGEQTETDYSIPKGLTLRDEMARYFRIGQALYEEFKKSETPTTATTVSFIEKLLRDVFAFQDIKKIGTRILEEHTYTVTLEALDGRVPVIIVPPSDALDRASDHLPSDGRKRSAATAIQDWLNADEESLWGFCSNGNRLRLVRDNASLTRPAYLEADLQQIFENDNFADFTTLWLLIHSSRFGLKGAPVSDCALERWKESGSKEGVAARDRLRDGVEQALLALGNGFLEHPRNRELRDQIEKGELPLQDFFTQLLRLVYRLIFLLAAEDRDLLHAPNSTVAVRKLYSTGYSLDHLRKQSVRRAAWDRHYDKWEGLLIVFTALAKGEPLLGLPALGGLFGSDAMKNLNEACLSNKSLMEAVYRLAWLKEDHRLTPVNWRDMETEELGSVYESLLELTPRLNGDGWRFFFAEGAETKGNARKTTGSYYTPDSLVQALLDSALDPVLDRVERESEDPEKGLLSVSTIDPACGSGHFLLAAARRIASRVARLRAGGVASAEDYRHALRDVVRNCVYGVDRNPMAVELTKVALWIETVEPGKPLGFLDANIRCGDALLGVFDLEALRDGIPDAAYKPLMGDDKETAKHYAQRNKSEKAGQGELGLLGEQSQLPPPPPFGKTTKTLRSLPEDSVKDIAEKREKFEAALHDPIRWKWRVAADMYVSAFLAPKVGGEPPSRGAAMIPTTAHLWEHLSNGQSYEPLVEKTQNLAEVARAFHWPLEFPDIMDRGGFDVVLGNPPWERVKLQEKEFFASRDPEISDAPNAAARRKLISVLENAEAGSRKKALFAEFEEAKRLAEAASLFARESGRYPLTGRGDVNTYPLFAEHFKNLTSARGRSGIIVPTGIATDATTAPFFASLVSEKLLAQLVDFENRDIFTSVHRSFKFCLLTLGHDIELAKFACFLTEIGHLAEEERFFTLTPTQIAQINPNTQTAPIFRSKLDAKLTAKIYEKAPILIEEKNKNGNPWNLSFMAMFHMSGDSGSFHTSNQLNDLDYKLNGLDWERDGHRYIPLYEAKMIHQFDHRWATYNLINEESRDCSIEEKSDPAFEPLPRYWVQEEIVSEKIKNKNWQYGWFLGYRRISNATNEKSLISALFPKSGVSESLTIFFSDQRPEYLSCLQQNLSSLVIDFISRQKIGGTNINLYYLQQFPILPPSAYTDSDITFIVARVLELTYTSHSMEPFARDLGYNGAPFNWDEERRALLRAELDAWYANAYGLTRDELRYILDPSAVMGHDYPSETFRVLKDREIKEYGEYRTQRLVLEAWDRMYGEETIPATLPIQIDPATLSDGAWDRPGDGPDAMLAQLAAIIKTLPGPVPIAKVRLATLYAWEPHYLTNRLEGQNLATWQRLVGQSAAPRTGAVTALSPRINAGWRDAANQLVGTGAIIEDINSQTWKTGTGLDDYITTTWPDGRAGFVMKALENIALNDAASDLTAEDQNWVLANAA